LGRRSSTASRQRFTGFAEESATRYRNQKYTPAWDLHQLRHTAISVRAAQGYNEIELKRFSGHQSLRSLEVYIAHNREAAKHKARAWERRDNSARCSRDRGLTCSAIAD
jgi:hypothetical protein